MTRPLAPVALCAALFAATPALSCSYYVAEGYSSEPAYMQFHPEKGEDTAISVPPEDSWFSYQSQFTEPSDCWAQSAGTGVEGYTVSCVNAAGDPIIEQASWFAVPFGDQQVMVFESMFFYPCGRQPE